MDIKEYLEVAYFISGIVMAGTIVIGIYQIRLLKRDLVIRNQRAAVEKSIEYLDWFASDFMPEYTAFQNQFNDIKKQLNENAKDKPKMQQLLKRVTETLEIKDDDFAKKPDNLNILEDIRLKILLNTNANDLLNQLEYFAAAMMSGLADEELAYKPLSTMYCRVIEEFYLIICVSRGDKHSNLYTNVIGLYKMWKNRLKKDALKGKRFELNEELAKCPDDTKVKAIGM
ncbi:hypothetical protein HN020_09255 [Brevibacillus borstelensis]|uniref:DUF4760 domain-containing protein n=1 Tax=Brevibacillus borstelensis TaxID=45462 RepID=UPI00149088DC|nr:hypothetical protein [Brevibacillus borstelensis]NOU54935.1 hypothetical protein [Brevibacillus borstelensis]